MKKKPLDKYDHRTHYSRPLVYRFCKTLLNACELWSEEEIMQISTGCRGLRQSAALLVRACVLAHSGVIFLLTKIGQPQGWLFKLSAFAAILTFAVSLAAQTGQITGQITDQTAASIQGASVTVTNMATDVSTQITTTVDGYYTAPFLVPGNYRITATKTGFKTASRFPVRLDVNQIARIDFRLDIGSQSEQVDVRATDAPLLQTESAAIGQVIGEVTVVDLPLNGRFFTQLTTLTPGAYNPVGNRSMNGATVIANGMRASNTIYTVNGVNTTDYLFQGTPILPAPDALQEFKIQTNGMEAQYGMGGAAINVDIKSGTNSFHGTVYEYFRNDKLDARDYFAIKKNKLRQNQFGFTFGGPIIKNRTFFFGDYQGTRINSGLTFNDIVPTDAMKAGNFTGLATIKDPTTGAPFANNQIPANRISPQAAFFLKFWPSPNTPQGNFVYNGVSLDHRNQGDIQIDHQLRSSDSLKATYILTRANRFTPGPFPDNGATTQDFFHQLVGLSEVHTFSPRILNQLTIGYTRFTSPSSQQGLGTNYTVQAGIGGFAETTASFPGFPALLPTGFTGLTNNAFQPQFRILNSWTFREVINISKGSHTIVAGMESTRHSNALTSGAHNRGEFTFSGVYTGNAWADYMLGLPFSANRSFPRDWFGYYQRTYEPFVQDTWKVTPRFTLSMGLRYSWFPGNTALHNVLSSVDPIANRIVSASDSQGNFQIGAQTVAPLLFQLFSNIIVPSSKVGLDNSITHPNHHNFGPRLGIAWQLGRGFVIRAGYGIIYSVSEGNQFIGTVAGGNLPFFADQNNILNTTPVPTLTLANYFPPVDAAHFKLPPITPYQLDPNAYNPYFQEFNLTVQKLIANAFTVEAAFVGSKGTHLIFAKPINIPLPGPGNVQARRPNPGFSSGLLFTRFDNSEYDSLQTKVETRNWKGLTLLGTYTWAKGMDYQNLDIQNFSVQDPNNLRAERAQTSQPASNFTVSAVYQLPFLKNEHGFLGAALSGWELTGIFTKLSGIAFTPTISTDPANTGQSKRPDRIGNGSLSNPTVNKWFDVAAFRVPAPFTYGNSGINILRGPGKTNLDFGLFKNFVVSEKVKLQFRTEFFNLTNTPYFGLPNTNIQAPQAGRILSTAGAPRQIQFALKLMF